MFHISLSLQRILMELLILTKLDMINRAMRLIFFFEWQMGETWHRRSGPLANTHNTENGSEKHLKFEEQNIGVQFEVLSTSQLKQVVKKDIASGFESRGGTPQKIG